ncbi:glycosyltransferase [Paenibacillus rubinfantis]|uniref:glycosyltransferase n=1 Tax=Paenibacillus rubinfantis TaxID=1720296 RepID=UPI00073E3F97|nr:glycosyltransferase [Paenibacillus rubinfantis]
MNRLWESVISPIIQHVSPKHIVEVGSEEGKTTRKILEYCIESDCILSAIDPKPLFNVQELVEQYNGKFFFYKDLSLNKIYELENFDIILLDGDHNWYTVFHELKMIDKQSGKSKFPIVFLHDSGWPYGRRDLYYNPELIPSNFLKPYKKQGIVPWQHDLVDIGFNMNLNNSIYENNDRNGVFTAVEDFLKETSKEVYHYNIEAFHGLTILFGKENKDIIDSIDVKKLTGDLEYERVNLLAKNRINILKKNELMQEMKESKKLDVLNEEIKNDIDDKIKEIEQLKNKELVLTKQINEYQEIIDKYKEKQLLLENKITRSENLLEELRKEKDKLEIVNRKRIHELKKRIADVKNEIRESASYRLGSILVNGLRNPIAFVKIPYNILKLYNEKHNRQKSIDLGVEKIDITEEKKYTPPTIIVPIYNAYEELKDCLKSIIDNTSEKYNLLLINDCSTDERIERFLELYRDLPQVTVINNTKNLGFIKNVNYGMNSVQTDVILLNSDTIVTPGWVRKLIDAAYSSSNIGTVTPLSNNAGPFSVPEPNYNVLPNDFTVKRMGEIVEKAGVNSYLEVPTGHGFCMYIKRRTIEDVGLFDDNTFGKGYCEENDFCMRALKKGWKNIVDDKTYIYHTESASFMESKAKIREINRLKLVDKHPEYPKLVKAFVTSKELKQIRERVKHELNKNVKH